MTFDTITIRTEAGKVGVITLAPLGEDVPGATPFWNWSEWPKLMITLCRNLLEK